MALQKSIATPYGIDAAYWHILSIDCNRVQSGLQVMMAGYASAAARAGGHHPLAVVGVRIDAAELPGFAEGVRYDELYTALRLRANAATAEEDPAALFRGASDC